MGQIYSRKFSVFLILNRIILKGKKEKVRFKELSEMSFKKWGCMSITVRAIRDRVGQNGSSRTPKSHAIYLAE